MTSRPTLLPCCHVPYVSDCFLFSCRPYVLTPLPRRHLFLRPVRFLTSTLPLCALPSPLEGTATSLFDLEAYCPLTLIATTSTRVIPVRSFWTVHTTEVDDPVPTLSLDVLHREVLRVTLQLDVVLPAPPLHVHRAAGLE